MTTAVIPEAVEQTYFDVEKMIVKICCKFQDKFGGNFEDHWSVADEAYMKAYNGFDGSRGFQFTTYVWWAVWNNLGKANRGKKIDRMTVNAGEFGDMNLDTLPNRSRFDLRGLLFEVSEDSKALVKLLLDDPGSFQSECSGGESADQRYGLIKHLQRSLGWTAARVVESFSEIREALG